jgi:hypothetical protein
VRLHRRRAIGSPRILRAASWQATRRLKMDSEPTLPKLALVFAAPSGPSPQADIVPHHRSLCPSNAEIQPGDAAIEVRAVSKHQALQQKGRSDQPQLGRYGSGAKRRSGTSHHGVRFGTAPTGADVRGARRSQDCHGPAIKRAVGWDGAVCFNRGANICRSDGFPAGPSLSSHPRGQVSTLPLVSRTGLTSVGGSIFVLHMDEHDLVA